MEFRRVAAAAVNEYCSANPDMCSSLPSEGNTSALPEDVIITSTTDSSGDLVVQFSVSGTNYTVPADVVTSAIRVSS